MRVENGKKVFSVREVNSYIGNIIKNDYLLKNICFEGEVSSFSKGPTGHLYITLKDCTAPGDLPEGAPYNGILRVNVWKSVAAKLNLPIVHNPCPANGETRRQEVKELIESLSERYPDLKQKLFGAMQRYPLYGWDVKNSEK